MFKSFRAKMRTLWRQTTKPLTLFMQLLPGYDDARAHERLLEAMSPYVWLPGLNIIKEANVSIPFFYMVVADLEYQGIVESKWDKGELDPKRAYRRRKLYKLKRKYNAEDRSRNYHHCR